MRQFMLLAFERFKDYSGPVPIVITGHSKEYKNNTEISNFLAWASALDQVEFTTFGGFMDKLSKFEKSKTAEMLFNEIN